MRMPKIRLLVFLACCAAPLSAQSRVEATFGSVVGPTTLNGVNYLIGGASDLVLDEARGRLYVVNPGQRRVEIYNTAQRRFLGVVSTDVTPISLALSADGNSLYVTCYDPASLNIIDLTVPQPAVSRRISLPAKPEGVAVGVTADGVERVLLTTTGSVANSTANVLLLFDPAPEADERAVQNVIVTPPQPPSPLLPPPSGRVAFAARTNLIATRDRATIIGFAAGGTNDRTLFVFDVNSGTVLRSRRVNETSTVLSVSPDGSRFMAGLRLFDTATLQVMAQQDAANLPYALTTGSNFNVQQNQGGSVFSPDGSLLYTAFNIAPLSNPPSRANVSQFLLNDPDNMLTFMGVKLPENLSGNMVITSDGGTIYALSESGFLIIPIGRLRESPLTMPESTALLLANDQCGITSTIRSGTIAINNAGAGRFNVTPELVPTIGPNAQVPALSGSIGNSVVVVLPPLAPGAPDPGGATFPNGNANLNTQQQAILQTSPSVRATNGANGSQVTFTYNTLNARSLGTTVPHDFQIYSPEAVNLPPQIRVFQNMRDADARASVLPVATGPSGAQGLTDMVADSARQRLYIANAGLNRVEVFDMRSRTFLAPIKVGQLPRSLALTPDGNSLFVANSGGESIMEIDMVSLEVVRRLKFPPLPFNSFAGIVTPQIIAATQRGLMVLMSNGTLWRVIDDDVIPRDVSPIIGTSTIPAPRSMAATSTGEFLLLLGGTGTAYLYDSLSDDFVQSRSVFPAPIQGYYGPITSGPRGAYFVVNGYVLNQSLGIVSAPPAVTPSGGRGNIGKPISGVAPLTATTFLRFSPQALATATQLPTEVPNVEVVNINTGLTVGSPYPALESTLATSINGGRVNIDGRLMAVDSQGTTAYMLTVSGLSIVQLQAVSNTGRPAIRSGGVVSFGSQTTPLPQGGIVSIYGANLGQAASVTSGNLPTTLGGICATINNTPLPLALTSPEQINLQLPMDLTPGRYSLIIRNLEQRLTSPATSITIARYAPAVLVDQATQQAAIYHEDGKPVTKDNKASRDDRLYIYAVGLGPVQGVRLVAGQPAPEAGVGTTEAVKVYFDNPTIKESEMDVEESIVMPGLVGVYRIRVYVPWYRRRGDKLLVTVRIGNVDSPSKGPSVPYIAVE